MGYGGLGEALARQTEGKLMETNWFNALTFEAFKKYGFEWDHRKDQEENSRLFLEAVENFGRDESYTAGYYDGGLFAH